MRYYLVCFDIQDNRYRRRLGKQLLAWGHRVQRSVFEIGLPSDSALQQLLDQIEKLQQQHQETGNIRFYRLLKPCRQASFSLNGEEVMAYPSTLIV